MKQVFVAVLMGLMPITSYATNHLANSYLATGQLGFSLNTSINSELYPVRAVPSLTYLVGKHQFEIGLGLNLFERADQNIFSAEANHKYFPNGTNKKVNAYLLSRLSYIHNARNTYYPSQYNYVFLNAGYGLEINAFYGAYIGTNVSAGVFSHSKTSTVPYDAFKSESIFDDINYNIAFQFNAGYRF